MPNVQCALCREEAGVDISKVGVFARIIATENDDICNKVIRGTNKQNIVYNEAFECTREFHKLLEQFFEARAQNLDASGKIYYERRSRQYGSNLTIKSWQKDRSSKQLATFRAFIQLIIRILADGSPIDVNNEKGINEYCERMLKQICDDNSFTALFDKAAELFDGTIAALLNGQELTGMGMITVVSVTMLADKLCYSFLAKTQVLLLGASISGTWCIGLKGTMQWANTEPLMCSWYKWGAVDRWLSFLNLSMG